MTRDINERLGLFIHKDGGAHEVQRLALNWDQVEQYRPPENPAKLTDSRAGGYIARFGASSWELDALEPSVLADLVRSAVHKIRDETLWSAAVSREDEGRQKLIGYASNYRSEHGAA